MVELVDSVDLGSTAKSVQVRVLLPAPNQYNPNLVFPVGDGFGLFVFFGKFEETHFRNGVIKRPESKPRGPRKKKQLYEDTVMDKNVISCVFNIDTACVEVKFTDGRMISIDCTLVEAEVARNIYESIAGSVKSYAQN